MKAIWQGETLAESDDTVVVDGRHYFPPDAIRSELFTESTRRSICPWKGLARYYDIEVNGQVNSAAAWYYAEPNPAAEHIKDRVAFWKGVQVVT